MIAKLNKIKNWQAVLIIIVIGFAVYCDGLKNHFMGDDSLQIVNNPVIHSIIHIKLFFEGGTFYEGQGLHPLSGYYFRPLMTTVFSLLYAIFGAHSFYFHLFQLLLCIGSALLLYLLFRYFTFKPLLSLFLALVLLVHPIDSQVVYAIPNMQDALFFFFGILALYLLLRFKSRKSSVAVAFSLFLALLSKESAVLFVALAVLYLFWFNRKRLYPFIGIMVVPITLWSILKTQAIGFLGVNPESAPIDKLSLAGRLMTAPSIMLFYISKLVFPWKLATAYYWTNPTFTVKHFLFPLIVDLIVVGIVVYLAFVIRKKASRASYLTYVFFAVWAALGIPMVVQIIPLDVTAAEPWFYFSMAGVLGMIGVVVTTFGYTVRLDRRVVLVIAALLILLFGIRTSLRGRDYRNPYILAKSDIAASSGDYTAYGDIASYDFSKGNYIGASRYAEQSAAIYPTGVNYDVLGESRYLLGDYPGAYTAYLKGLSYQPYYALYNDLALLTPYYGSAAVNERLLLNGTKLFPNNATLWYYLAIIEYRSGDSGAAKSAIIRAHSLEKSNTGIKVLYGIVMSGHS